ncbi:hypothetical protein J1N35_021740 [Gossypium stocksii]|uniref:Uncharacterized protein n=1 Tax=Gossypium stocksii TaxID=47602 RepID=A0A9D3VHB2_9ROSI|nr:hypothetical protein J1N35_021740 [Gossypium stocksii]
MGVAAVVITYRNSIIFVWYNEVTRNRKGLNPYNPHFILQDFLPRPFSKDPPGNRVSANGDTTFFVSPPPPPPASLLSLNSGPSFDFLNNSCPLNSKLHLQM